jgi:serine/threonine protein kinase
MTLDDCIVGQKELYICGKPINDPYQWDLYAPAYRRRVFGFGNEKIEDYYVKTWITSKHLRSASELESTKLLKPHQNILLPEEIVKDYQGIHFVYPLMEGKLIGDYLDKVCRESDLLKVLYILEETASGLEHIHSSGVVHRDIKPGNIWLKKDFKSNYGFKPIIYDWDFSGKKGEIKDPPGKPTGTAAYMAPEQIKGEPTTPSSDLYALGVIIFEIIEGKLPVAGSTPQNFIHTHQYPERRRIEADIPEAVRDVVGRMVMLRQEDRYQTLQEMVSAFREAIE